MKYDYIKPKISVIEHVCHLMDNTMSVYGGSNDEVVDDENDILSKGAWGNIFSEEEDNSTGWK
jgi:hypothetical protein